jgi:hypothetical protein
MAGIRGGWLVLALAVLAGCGGSSASGSGDGGGSAATGGGSGGTGASNGGSGGSSGGAASCAADGVQCGAYLSADGDAQDCGRCAFSKVELPGPGTFRAAQGPSGLVVALEQPGAPDAVLSVAHELSDGGFAMTPVDSASFFDADNPAHVGVGPHGEEWLLYVKDSPSGVFAAKARATPLPDGGAYDIEEVALPGGDNIAALGDVVVDAQGNPHTIYEAAGFAPYAVKHLYRTAAGWTAETLETVDGSQHWPAIAIGPGDALHFAYVVDAVGGGLHHAVKAAGGIQVETVEAFDGTPGITAITVGTDGLARIAYELTVGQTRFATQTAGGWQLERPALGARGDLLSLALDGSGRPYATYRGSDGLRLATRTDTGAWPAQTVVPNAYASQVFVDGQGRVRVVADPPNGGYPDGNPRVLTLQGPYSAAYVAACADIASQVCAKARSCAGSSSSEVCWSNGGLSCASACASNVLAEFCGDATQPESEILDCDAKMSQLTCAPIDDPEGDGPSSAADVTVCAPL